jgi:hypothetical protein
MGKGHEEAREAALSEVALYFGTTIEVQKQLITRYNEVVSGNQKTTEKESAMESASKISSQADFMGAHFTSPWYNEQNRTWYILAYINKQEAAELYQKRINTNRMIMESLVENEGEPLLHYQALKKAASIAQMLEADIKALGNISTIGSEYEETLRYAQKIIADSREFRSHLSFSAAIEEDKQGKIQRKLLDVLEKNEYVTVRGQGDYTISGAISWDEEILPVGVFVYSGISLQLSNSAGKLLFSYTRSYPRLGSRNQNMAYNIAFREIEKDLEANFIREFNAFLGD